MIVDWGRDVVGFKILRGFCKLEQGSGVLLQNATTYIIVVRCRSDGQK